MSIIKIFPKFRSEKTRCVEILMLLTEVNLSQPKKIFGIEK